MDVTKRNRRLVSGAKGEYAEVFVVVADHCRVGWEESQSGMLPAHKGCRALCPRILPARFACRARRTMRRSSTAPPVGHMRPLLSEKHGTGRCSCR
jgi:hypothetical protein